MRLNQTQHKMVCGSPHNPLLTKEGMQSVSWGGQTEFNHRTRRQLTTNKFHRLRHKSIVLALDDGKLFPNSTSRTNLQRRSPYERPIRLFDRCFATVLLLTVFAAAQVPSSGAKSWAPPRTPDGQPDLQGVWTNMTVTQLERPAELAGKEFFTESEAFAVREESDFRSQWRSPGRNSGC